MIELEDCKQVVLNILQTQNVESFIFYSVSIPSDIEDGKILENTSWFSEHGNIYNIGQCDMLKDELIRKMKAIDDSDRE